MNHLYNQTKLLFRKFKLLSLLKKIKIKKFNLKAYIYYFFCKYFDKNIPRNEVPKILFTSYSCSKKNEIVKRIIQKWSELNKDFEVKYFSDKDIELILLHVYLVL